MTKIKTMEWLLAHKDYQGDDCLRWPFSLPNGYGITTRDGRQQYAHRIMCELVNGPAPTPGHYATHSCGRGHEGCVNPKHLRWLTPSENQFERREHNSHNRWGKRGKLTHSDRLKIRDLAGKKPQREIAEMFGISRAAVSKVLIRKTWERVRGVVQYGSRWHAKTRIDGREVWLGTFATQDEARQAYEAAMRKDVAAKRAAQSGR